MAPGKSLSLYFILFLSISLPLSSYPSPTPRQNPETVAVNPADSAVMQVNGKGIESSPAGEVRDSLRQVPTGPDPLHHNDDPVTP